ncbi:MAG: hypothetical protein K2M16_06640, partial [Muribaculaceae bacterium]|nr:hypothetical protein [Muribaculaceae bacterium]
DCRYNPLTFATLPCKPGELAGEYLYAPQNGITIASKGPSSKLPDVGMDVDGVATKFIWYKEDGSVLVEGKDYEIINGAVVFKDYSIGNVYCSMTNSVFPELTLTTSEMRVAAPPTKVLGWMDVADYIYVSPEKEMYLSAAGSKEGDTIYINWDGQGSVYSEYLLGPTYRIFKLDPEVGRRAVVYSYEDDDEGSLLVFSLNNVPLKAADFSGMTSLTDFDISNAGCKDIVLPESDRLESLGLNGNGIESIDSERLKGLKRLYADDNYLHKFDLSEFPSLEIATLNGNGMTDIKFGNPNLWHLGLEKNLLEHIGFEGLPSLHQAYLRNNSLKSIDIDGPQLLRALFIDGNNFDFQTLPIVPETVTEYHYSDQARIPAVINGLTVDLSSQAQRDGVNTVYYWCVDEPF